MIRLLTGMCASSTGLRALCVGLALLLPQVGRADPDPQLSDALTNCWNAVAGGGLEALSAYGMEFEKTEVIREGVENHTYLGTVTTGVGDIDIRATIRDDILFDCTMLTFPLRPGQQEIQIADAEDTLAVWYDEGLAWPGSHEAFKNVRYHSLVWCGPQGLAISANAMSIDPLPPEVIEEGSTEPLTGGLRAVVFLTNAANYDQCT